MTIDTHQASFLEVKNSKDKMFLVDGTLHLTEHEEEVSGIGFMKLGIRAILEQISETDEHYSRAQLFDEIKTFSEKPTVSENQQSKNKFFFRTPKDGRAYRFFLKPSLDTDSYTYKFLELVGNILGNHDVVNLGMMFQIKGGGANFKTIKDAQKEWYKNSRRPEGLTGEDTMDNFIAETIGIKRASRWLLGTFSITAVGNKKIAPLQNVKLWEEKPYITGSKDKPLVLELFAVPGGFCISDLNYIIENKEGFDIWEYFFNVGKYYFRNSKEYRAIDPENPTKAEKKLLAALLVDKWIDDFSKLIEKFKIDGNRTEHNTTLFSQDFDRTRLLKKGGKKDSLNAVLELHLESFLKIKNTELVSLICLEMVNSISTNPLFSGNKSWLLSEIVEMSMGIPDVLNAILDLEDLGKAGSMVLAEMVKIAVDNPEIIERILNLKYEDKNLDVLSALAATSESNTPLQELILGRLERTDTPKYYYILKDLAKNSGGNIEILKQIFELGMDLDESRKLYLIAFILDSVKEQDKKNSIVNFILNSEADLGEDREWIQEHFISD